MRWTRGLRRWRERDTHRGHIVIRIGQKCVRRVGILRFYRAPFIRLSRGVYAYLVFGLARARLVKITVGATIQCITQNRNRPACSPPLGLRRAAIVTLRIVRR